MPRQRSRITSRTLRHQSQRGVIIVVALVMLLIMTVAGVTTMTGATLQERIAGNQRQRAVSRINADRALRVAESYLDSLHGTRSMPGVAVQTDFLGNGLVDADGLYLAESIVGGGLAKPLTLDRLDESTWTVDNSIAVPSEANVTSRYVIEYLGGFDSNQFAINDNSGDQQDAIVTRNASASQRKVFRITAIGFGNNTNVVSILESYYLEASQQ